MFGNLDSGSLNDSDSSKSFGNKGNIHEGEYVSIPSRNSLPINRTTTTTTANESSTCNTPIRIDSPISLVGDSMNDQKMCRHRHRHLLNQKLMIIFPI